MEIQNNFNNVANTHYFDHKKINVLKNLEDDEISFSALSDYIDTDEKQQRLTKHVIKNSNNLRFGDTLVFCNPEHKYRNAATCVWNGKSIELLDHTIDEYGALPKSIKISDNKFGPRYWSNAISHNDYYWVCDEYRQEAFENAEIKFSFLDNDVKDYFVSKYTHNGNIEYLVLNEDCVDDNYTIEHFKKLILNKNIPWGFDGSDYEHLFNSSNNISVITNFNDDESNDDESNDNDNE
jgi:hypothetical protein